MKRLQQAVAASAAIITGIAPGAAAQRPSAAPTTDRDIKAVDTGPDFVTCDKWIDITYRDETLYVFCSDNQDPAIKYKFEVAEGDLPSPAEVIGFVQPYYTTVKTLQAMPRAGDPTSPINGFNQRVGFHLSYGKITGIRMMTVND